MKYGYIYPHSLGVPPGSTAQFICHSIVQPVWTRQGNALNSRSTVVNNSLIIKQVKTTDEGKYRCVGIDNTKSLFIRSSHLYVGGIAYIYTYVYKVLCSTSRSSGMASL